MAFEEFNGVPGKSGFSPSVKLTERIAAQLTKPVMFEYVKGRIGDIRAAAEVSNTVVNIMRGILGFLQVTIKATQKVYELEEVCIQVSHTIHIARHFYRLYAILMQRTFGIAFNFAAFYHGSESTCLWL